MSNGICFCFSVGKAVCVRKEIQDWPKILYRFMYRPVGQTTGRDEIQIHDRRISWQCVRSTRYFYWGMEWNGSISHR